MSAESVPRCSVVALPLRADRPGGALPGVIEVLPIEDLKERILEFINSFNRTMAKPIRWLYSPRPLKDEEPYG